MPPKGSKRIISDDDGNASQPASKKAKVDAGDTGPVQAPAGTAEASSASVSVTASATNDATTGSASGVDKHNAPTEAPVEIKTVFNGLTVPDHVAKRIAMMLAFADEKKAIFAVGKMPAGAAWGSGVNSNYAVAKRGHTTRAMVWVVGQIDYVGITNGEKLLGVNVLPIHEDDMKAVRSIQARLAQPALKPSDIAYDTVRFSHWKSTHGVEASLPVSNGRLFDATSGFNKNAMPALEVEAFKQGDFVLAEGYLHKYAVREGKTKTGVTRASFDLASVSLLHSITDEEGEAYVEAKKSKVKGATAQSDDIVI